MSKRSRNVGATLCSRALIVVFNPDDVVFAEIASSLDLDQLQHDFTGVLHPVHSAHRDVNGLVLVHAFDGLVDGDAGGAADHDPVLGAMMVLLQRQAPARLHHDVLDLVALAIVDRLVAAPGPMYLK